MHFNVCLVFTGQFSLHILKFKLKGKNSDCFLLTLFNDLLNCVTLTHAIPKDPVVDNTLLFYVLNISGKYVLRFSPLPGSQINNAQCKCNDLL